MTTEEYNAEQKENTPPDIEDIGNKQKNPQKITNIGRKRTRQEEEELFVGRSWKDALGEMPPFGDTAQERRKWFKFQKQKWQFQRKQRQILRRTGKVNRKAAVDSGPQDGTLGAIRKRAKTVLDQFWSIIQVTASHFSSNNRHIYPL